MKRSMSNKLRTLSIITALVISCGLVSTPSAAQYYDDYDDYNNNPGYYDDRYDNGDYQQFYDDLAPHGTWMQDPDYGYVWSPRAGRDFRPYFSDGRWVMTDMGNMWMSDYSWGAIPFHYGRWVHSNYYGWLWIPGSQWAPSWVVWRQGGGYYGWAPMGPSMNINMNFGAMNISFNLWNFIPVANIYSGRYYSYRRPNVNNVFINNTTIINNYHSHNRTRFFAGPRATDVRRAIGRNVDVYKVNTVSTRGRNGISGNRITAYAPNVRKANSRTQSAPRSVSRIDNSRSINGGNRTVTNRSSERVRNKPSRANNTERKVAAPSRNINSRPVNNRSASPKEAQRTATPVRTNPSRTAAPKKTPTAPRQQAPTPSRSVRQQPMKANPGRTAQPSRASAPSRNISQPKMSSPSRSAAGRSVQQRSNGSDNSRSSAPSRSSRGGR